MTQDTGDKSTDAVAPGQETQDCAGALQDLAPARPRRGCRGKPADPEPGKEKTPPKTKAAPKALPKSVPKKTNQAKAKAASAPKKPAPKKRTREEKAKEDRAVPRVEKERRPRVALSGFSSSDLTKYGSLVTRLGGTVSPGHGWDAAATHVVFGDRGGRSLKFLAAAASGVPILDVSYLDASGREGALLPREEARSRHPWRGGRGAEMGLLTPDAAERWNATPGRRAFEGLSVALAPFASKNREERDMLATVLERGGAVVSAISAKGELVPGDAEPDVAVIDPSNGLASDGLRGRAGLVVDAVVGGACVAPEFFKSWLSRPGADLSRHVLHGSLESGKLAASVRASLGGVGPAPPLNPNPDPQNNVAASIPTASKAKARAKKAADATDKAAAPPPAESGRRKRKAAAAAEPQPARYSRRALVVKN